MHCESLEYRLLLAGDALVCVEYAFVDEGAPGTPLTSLVVGQDYQLQAFIRDNRPGDPLGLFQAFFDVSYDSALISVNGEIIHGPQFDLAPQGDASVPGFIDEVGALSRGLANPGNGTFLLYAVPIHADAAGMLEISAQPDEIRHVLFQDSLDPVPLADIGFEGNTIEIVDADISRVSIAATQNGNEAGAVPGVFTVTQSLVTGSNTLIQYTVGGTATAGGDYTPLSGTATILAGQVSTAINVPVTNDALVEAIETVVVTLNSISQGDPSVSIDQAAKQATLNITDNDSAQISIAATTGGNETGPVAGRFTVTQTAASSTNTVISFTLGGTATVASDYASIPTSVTILAGNTTAIIDIPVINDSAVEGPETVIATLTGITSGDPQITLQGGGTQATLSIADNDTALVRVAATTNGSESGPTSGVFTVTQTATSPSNTVIAYSLSGTATPGADYTAPSGSVTIVAGMTAATITVPVLGDAIVEADESIILTLNSITSGNPQVSVDQAQKQATLSISDNDSAQVRIAKTADGSESGPVNGQFTVTQTAVSSTNTVVSYTVGGTATPGSDYTAPSGTVTIPAGQTSATINVPVIDDGDSESTETVVVTLQSITSGDPQIQIDTGQNQATVEITDDETPLVRIAKTNDGSENGPIDGRFTVSQTIVMPSDTVVAFTVSGTATSGIDFAALSGTATIPAGQTSVPIDVEILDDNLIEGAETVIVTLTEITSGEPGLLLDELKLQATVAIADDETGLISIVATNDGSENGPEGGLFTVTQNGTAAVDTVISYTVSGTADAGDDYTALSGTVTILAGQTSATISVDVLDDPVVEPDETVLVTLSGIVEGSPLLGIDLQQTTATARILDDDTATVAFESATGGSEDGPAAGAFMIVQSAPSSTDTVIHYIALGTATGGIDFAALSGTVTIPASQMTATIGILVFDDMVVEATETVSILLTTLDTGGAQVTIDLDHASATIEIADNDSAQVSVSTSVHGNEAGPIGVVFIVSLIAPSSTDTEVQYTLGGTATADSDYTAPTDTIVIPAGSTSQPVSIAVIDDQVLEGTETVTIMLGPITSGDADISIDPEGNSAAADILDNETGLIRIAATTPAGEAGPAAGQFTITQDGTTDLDTVVAYTVGGMATPGEDYVTLSGTVTIPSGQLSATIDVTVLDDQLIEGDQTVVVTLATITDGDERLAIDPAGAVATLSIIDDDTGLVSIANGGNGSETGPVSGSFVVSQSGTAGVDTMVSYTVTGTAASGSDYVVLSGTVTIPAGQTSATIVVNPIDDNIVEATETVVVTLDGITSGAALVIVDANNNAATVQIADNDSAQVSVSATAGGNETGPVSGVFTVTQSAVSSSDTVISYTIGGTATSGSDYTALSGTVTILAGNTSATVSVPVINDTVVEGTETVTLTLNNISGGDANITINGDQASASLEIQDNDNATIAFASAASSIFEILGNHTVIVRLSISGGGTLGQSVTVNVSNTGGTAGPGDFTLDTTSVTFAAGSQDGAQRNVNLTITNDSVLEPNETVVLRLAIGNDGTGGRAAIGGTASHTVTIFDDPISGVISGFVWADTNGNGSRDADEIAIPGVTVRLDGIDARNQPVERVATTDDNGAYSFAQLPIGTYDVSEQQPQAFNDSGESLGTVGGVASGQVGNDRFTGIALGPAGQGVNYNFGEWGLKAQYVNVRMFLATTTKHGFILRDTILAAEAAAQSLVVAAPQVIATALPQVIPSSSTQVVPSSSMQVAPVVVPQSALSTASAADASIAGLLASTLANTDAEPEMAALAFATALSAEAGSTDDSDAATPLLLAADDEPPPASPAVAGMLLEDTALDRNFVETPGVNNTSDEASTDQALDEEELWLDELIA